MSNSETLPSDHRHARPVFVSYATADRKEALAVCKAIERRGSRCWISCRDVAPGQNYQEEIARSVRNARAVVLVFSDAANNSDEIKKELSLGSRYHVPVMALRIEDVEPSDAFAYELSTRQWIDAFEGWDKSLDALVARIAQIPGAEPVALAATTQARRRTGLFARRRTWIASGDRWRRLLAVAPVASRGAQHDGALGRLPAVVARPSRDDARGRRRGHDR